MPRRKTKSKSRSCPRGKIRRKAYTTKRGTHVKSKCIKDRGAKGKGPKVIPKLKKGLLAKYGYHHVLDLSVSERHAALKKALKAYGRDNLIDKLSAVVVLNKRTNPRLSRVFKADENWVRKQRNVKGRSRSGSKKRRKTSTRRKSVSKRRCKHGVSKRGRTKSGKKRCLKRKRTRSRR